MSERRCVVRVVCVCARVCYSKFSVISFFPTLPWAIDSLCVPNVYLTCIDSLCPTPTVWARKGYFIFFYFLFLFSYLAVRDRLLRAYACVGQERIFYFKGIGFFNVVPQVLDQLLSVCHHGLVCRRRYLFEDLGFRGLGFRVDGV